MDQRRTTLLVWAATSVAALAFLSSPITVTAGAAAQQASADRQIWDGVFTPVDAPRGIPRFEEREVME
jgi:hypothetical protein